MISSSCATNVPSSVKNSDHRGGGHGPGGAGHERGSTHSVQSLLNLDNINAQWDILTNISLIKIEPALINFFFDTTITGF